MIPAVQQVSLDRNDYGFRTEIRVRLSETDAVGIVFFGSFSSYLDVGRMDYLANLGLSKMDGPVRDLIPGVVVASELSFLSPTRYNDALVIHVRIARIGRSSYTFHFLLDNKRTNRPVAVGALTLVWMDDSMNTLRVPEAFRATVAEFEGDGVSVQ